MSSAPAIVRQRAPVRRWSAAKATAASTEPTSPRKESWFGRTRSPTRARATGSATRATSPLYWPSIGHGLRGERRLDRLAEVLERGPRLDLPAPAIRHVERVERVVEVGRDLRGRDVEPLRGERSRDEVEQPEPVRRLHFHHGVGIGERVVDNHAHRAGRRGMDETGSPGPRGEERLHRALAGEGAPEVPGDRLPAALVDNRVPTRIVDVERVDRHAVGPRLDLRRENVDAVGGERAGDEREKPGRVPGDDDEVRGAELRKMKYLGHRGLLAQPLDQPEVRGHALG